MSIESINLKDLDLSSITVKVPDNQPLTGVLSAPEAQIPLGGSFAKVSFDQFKKDWKDLYNVTNEKILKEMYENIKLPKHGTKDSAGYDFIAYKDFYIYPGSSIVIPTGIKCKLGRGLSLDIYPRSGQGFKYKLEIANTVGIIDSDYYNNKKNEGHIMIKLTFVGIEKVTTFIESYVNGEPVLNQEMVEHRIDSALFIKKGTGYAQGIIHQYLNVYNGECNTNDTREGGLGSTTKEIKQ